MTNARPAGCLAVIGAALVGQVAAVVLAVVAAKAGMFPTKAIAGVVVLFPGLLLGAHALLAWQRGAIPQRIARSPSFDDPREYRWALRVWGADVLRRDERPTVFRIYVFVEAALAAYFLLSVTLPLIERGRASPDAPRRPAVSDEPRRAPP